MDSTSKQIARHRVQILYQQANRVYDTNPKLAQRYLVTARKIAMAARIRLPANYRRQTCRDCNALLVPGSSCRVRVKPKRETHVVVTCFICGCQMRYPVKTKKEKMNLEQNNHQDEAPRQA